MSSGWPFRRDDLRIQVYKWYRSVPSSTSTGRVSRYRMWSIGSDFFTSSTEPSPISHHEVMRLSLIVRGETSAEETFSLDVPYHFSQSLAGGNTVSPWPQPHSRWPAASRYDSPSVCVDLPYYVGPTTSARLTMGPNLAGYGPDDTADTTRPVPNVRSRSHLVHPLGAGSWLQRIRLRPDVPQRARGRESNHGFPRK